MCVAYVCDKYAMYVCDMCMMYIHVGCVYGVSVCKCVRCMCMIDVCGVRDMCACIYSRVVDRGGQAFCFITLGLIPLVQDPSLDLELVIFELAGC